MARLVFGMNVSLDGYVDHTAFAGGPELFAHWTAQVAGLAGSIYGRRMYEIMRYWDDDQPGWSAADHAFATAWRRQPKWVVSRSSRAVGPNATLVTGDVETTVRGLKAQLAGELAISGPALAHSLAGLVDEYRLYLHPVVLGGGTPFFAGPLPSLRPLATESIDGKVTRLSYAPA